MSLGVSYVKKNLKLFSIIFFTFTAHAQCNLASDYSISENFHNQLNNLCSSLVAQTSPKLNVELILTDEMKYPNAYAFVYKNQRIILISKPLIAANKSDPKLLAFVIGHELGHHQFDIGEKASLFARILDKAKFGAMSVINTDFSSSSLLVKYAILGMGNQYDRAKELDADMYSVKLMEAIGLSKADAIRSLQVVDSNTNNPIWTKFLNDHPDTKIRINSIK